MSSASMVSIARAAGPVLLALIVSSAAADGPRPTIVITGYWPPTNEMIRPFSTDPDQNPDGWIGGA